MYVFLRVVQKFGNGNGEHENRIENRIKNNVGHPFPDWIDQVVCHVRRQSYRDERADRRKKSQRRHEISETSKRRFVHTVLIPLTN